MEKDITSRLERWTGQANGVARQESRSMIGVSIVRDYFRPDIDPNTALSQVSSLAISDMYYLPPGIEGDRATQRVVKTGLESSEWIQIVEGLSPEDEVVVAAANPLTDGMSVTTSATEIRER